MLVDSGKRRDDSGVDSDASGEESGGSRDDSGGETTWLGGETTQAEDDVGGTTWAVSGEMNHEHVGAQVGEERTLKGELAQVGEAIRGETNDHCSCLLLHASLELYNYSIITWKYIVPSQ